MHSRGGGFFWPFFFLGLFDEEKEFVSIYIYTHWRGDQREAKTKEIEKQKGLSIVFEEKKKRKIEELPSCFLFFFDFTIWPPLHPGNSNSCLSERTATFFPTAELQNSQEGASTYREKERESYKKRKVPRNISHTNCNIQSKKKTKKASAGEVLQTTTKKSRICSLFLCFSSFLFVRFFVYTFSFLFVCFLQAKKKRETKSHVGHTNL